MRLHAVCALALLAAPAQADISFTRLGSLALGNSFAFGVSGDGRTVVGSTATTGATNAAFRWTAASGMTLLPPFGGAYSSTATAANSDGSVIVGETSVASNIFGIRWTPSNYQLLGLAPGGSATWATAVNSSGSAVVGGSRIGEYYRACVWRNSAPLQDLGLLPGYQFSRADTVSDNGQIIAGNCMTWTSSIGFRWTPAGMQALPHLPGATSSRVEGASADGSIIVGWSNVANLAGWCWTEESGLQVLPPLPGQSTSYAAAISADGSTIVGSSGPHLAIWTDSGVFSLTDLLGSLVPPDLSYLNPYAISADGTVIVGRGMRSDGYYEAWVAVIPSPGAGALLCFAGPLLAGRRNRVPARGGSRIVGP